MNNNKWCGKWDKQQQKKTKKQQVNGQQQKKHQKKQQKKQQNKQQKDKTNRVFIKEGKILNYTINFHLRLIKCWTFLENPKIFPIIWDILLKVGSGWAYK